MDRLEFEAELRREGYRVVNSSLKPNMVEPNHCHDFDAKLLVLGGEITITRDNTPETFRAGQSCEVPAGCMHAEHVGPEGVAYVAGGRRRNGGPLTREAFESDLRREGFEVAHGGQTADQTEDMHAHSLFEPSTEVIRKGKASRPTEFGKLVKLQEAENQIIVAYEVYARRPNDSDLLMPAIEVHAAKLGCIPRLVAADAGFYSAKNEAAAKAKGVKRVCIPNRGSKSAARKQEQKKRWFRNGQRWRTGCEGRISVSKRRHGLQRCRYRGDDGMRRWVGLGVIADNLINIGRVIAAEPAT